MLQQQGHAAAAAVEGWESYWACNEGERGGFNGVCTYARWVGVCVRVYTHVYTSARTHVHTRVRFTPARHGTTLEANGRPFGVKQLDDEGRALVTVHAAFASAASANAGSANGGLADGGLASAGLAIVNVYVPCGDGAGKVGLLCD